MKKFLAVALLSATLIAVSQKEASAWSKWSFSAGVNLSYEGGNNSAFWGMFQSGQVPGYATDVGHSGPFGGYPAGYGSAPIASYGGSSYGYAPSYGHAPSAPSTTPEWSAPAPKPEAPKKTEQANWYGNQYYQPAVYQYQAPSYQAAPQYPHYQQGYHQQVPSYWYGY